MVVGNRNMTNKNTKKRPIVKYILIGIGTIAGLVLAAVIIIVIKLSRSSENIEITGYHPFKSPEAKEQYLNLYDLRAEKWPVASETKIVPTSYGQTFVRISVPNTAPPLILQHGGGGNSLQWIGSI